MGELKSTFTLGYPTEPCGPFPAFQSIEEEAVFWDTHSFDGSELEPEDLVEDYRDDGSFRIRLSPEDLRKLTDEAKRLGKGASVFAGELLKESLDVERNPRDLTVNGELNARSAAKS